MGLFGRIFPLALYLVVVCSIGQAAELKILLLDSNSGHGLHNKLVCISFPSAESEGPVISKARDCQRTDSTGTAEFHLPDPAPKKVHVELSSYALSPCYEPQSFDVSQAASGGVVAKNTCGKASTTLLEDGEVIVFGHQSSFWQALKSRSDEF